MRLLLCVLTGLASHSAGAQELVPMRDVELAGRLRGVSHDMDAVVRVRIQTPFGKVPISSHGRLHYLCGGSFSGSMSYSPIVRFFARLKGVKLVTALDGHIAGLNANDCETFSMLTWLGRAKVDSTILSGWVKVGGDSIILRGSVWNMGDSSYHSVLAFSRGGVPLQLHINMYKKARGMPPAERTMADAGPEDRIVR